MKRAPILILLLIFSLAFSLRAIYIGSSQHLIDSDELHYDELAMDMVKSKGYIASNGLPTSQRPPLYPAFLALMYTIFGHNHLVVKIIQTFASSLTVCLFYLIALHIFNRKTAMLAGIFSSFYMPFVVCNNLLYTETLFTFLIAILIYIVIRLEKPDKLKFCLLGLLCGLATLIRGLAIFLPFVAIFFLAIKLHKRKFPTRDIIITSLILIFSFLVVLLPWTARNYKVHKTLVLVSTNAGLNMYQAINPVRGKIYGLGPRDKVSRKAWEIQNEVERDRFFMQKALETYKKSSFSRILRLFVIRFLFFWNVIDWEIIGGNIINFYFIFIIPFAFLGTILSLKNKKEVYILLFIILYFTAQILIFQGTPRYRMPIDGYVIILGCYGIYGFVERQKKKLFPILGTASYFFLTYLLYLNSPQTKHFIKSLMEKVGLW